MTSPNVSVIVCTYNRAAMLRDALVSLSRLETGGQFTYEVIVVDNASTDTTPEVVAEVARSSEVPIRGVRELRRGVPAARNRGLAEAMGEWIAFFDDDQIADRHWLLELLNVANRFRALCAGGAVTLRLPENSQRKLAPICRSLLGETVGRDTVCRYERGFMPGAGNLLIHRHVLDVVGGFHEPRPESNRSGMIRGEDTEFFARIAAAGFEAWYTPKAVIEHVIPPERLQPDKLYAIATLAGMGTAEGDQRRFGAAFRLVGAARLGRGLGIDVPRWLFGRVTRNRELSLGCGCRLAMHRGYLRYLRMGLLPRNARARREPLLVHPPHSTAERAANTSREPIPSSAWAVPMAVASGRKES